MLINNQSTTVSCITCSYLNRKVVNHLFQLLNHRQQHKTQRHREPLTRSQRPSPVLCPARQFRVQVTFGVFDLERSRLLHWRGQSLYRQTQQQWVGGTLTHHNRRHTHTNGVCRQYWQIVDKSLGGSEPMQPWLLLELSLAGDFPLRMGMPQLTE